MKSETFYISENDAPAKQRILREAMRLFARQGLSATSIRDIADAAGYTNPALYKHFRTKEALALLLFERSYSELQRHLTRAVAQSSGFPEKLRAFLSAYCAFYDAHPNAMIFLTDYLPVFWSQVSDDMRQRTIVTLLRETLDQGKAAGFVGDTNTELQMTLVIGTLGQLTRQIYLGALKGPSSKHVEEIEQLLRKGLA